MAKLRYPSGVGGNRTPALGPGYRISMWRGVIRIQSAGIRKRKTISAKQRQAMIDFAHLANVAKAINPTEREAADRMSKGTQYLWRDLVYMAVSGRLMHFMDENGGMWFSMAARTGISDMLDSISQIPGTMLYRGENWWDVIGPGLPGNVLTWPADGSQPYWAESGAAGGLFAFNQARNTWTNNGQASMGCVFEVPFRLRLDALRCNAWPNETRTYRADVWTQSGLLITGRLGGSPDVTANFALEPYPTLYFDEPAEIPPYTPVMWTLTRRDAAGGNSANIETVTATLTGMPWARVPTGVALATNNPQVGDQFFGAGSGQVYAMNGMGAILGYD